MKNIENKIKRMRKLMLESEGSPEENDLIDGIRDILKKQKKNKDEDVYYDDLERLLKNLNVPLQEKVESMVNLMEIRDTSDFKLLTEEAVEGEIYKSKGDPYEYKIQNGTWFARGNNLSKWTSLRGNAKATNILNKRYGGTSSPKTNKNEPTQTTRPTTKSSKPSTQTTQGLKKTDWGAFGVKDKITKSPFSSKKHGLEYREWLNSKLPKTSTQYDVDPPSKLGERFKNTESLYNNKNIINSLNHFLTWKSGKNKGKKVSVWEYYQIKNPDWNKKSFKEKIETDDVRLNAIKGFKVKIPQSVPGADRINKELFYINARTQYDGKPFFIVDPRLNLVLAFDKNHQLVDYSQSVASGDKQQDVLFTRKEWCEISHKNNSYEKLKGKDVCVRREGGKTYVSLSSVADADNDIVHKKGLYRYDVLAKEKKRYAQKGIYNIRSRYYKSGYQGEKGIPNTFGLEKDGINVGTAIHALVPVGSRLEADKDLKALLQKDLSGGSIPKEYIDMVEKDFLSSGKSKYDLSAGCFNVDPKFIQNPKVQTIAKFPGVPVFIMGEGDTDYLVQVEPGKEGEFMMDMGGKDGKCISPSSLENKYGNQIDVGLDTNFA